MEWQLAVAFALNLTTIACQIFALANIKNKIDIFKYYTYLQNLLALVFSAIFCLFVVVHWIWDNPILQFVRGLRYVGTCGLVATMTIYLLFIGKGKNVITQKDVCEKVSPRLVDLLLHYLCPVVSLLSFVLFERTLPLSDGIWTALVNAPSVLYWIAYLLLTVKKAWKQPYDFSSKDNKSSNFRQALTFVLIALIFVAICILVWNVK